MLSKRQHTERRRILASSYSRTNIQNSTFLTALSQSIVGGIWRSKLDLLANSREIVDMHRMNKALFVDLTTAWVFGRSQVTNFLCDDADADQFFQNFKKISKEFFWRGEFFSLVAFLHRIGVSLVPSEVSSARHALQRWFSALCDAELQAKPSLQATDRDTSDEGTQNSVFTLLWRGLRHAALSEESVRASLEAELFDHLAAGHDVTGITLTYLMYSISQHPRTQSELRAEIKTLQQTSHSQNSLAQRIEALPLLHAVVLETLRLYSPNPGPWPRVVPSFGYYIDRDKSIPSGTIIAASSYVLHRNAHVFPEPEKWKPERWLEATTNQRKEMDKWFWAFGSGARVCIGIHYAMRSK